MADDEDEPRFKDLTRSSETTRKSFRDFGEMSDLTVEEYLALIEDWEDPYDKL